MSRYIDADLLLAQCRRNPLFEKTEKDKGMIYIERSIIDAIPTADVVEVRHGEWAVKDLKNPLYESKKAPHCSVCNYMSFIRYDYCPNCGAKMDGERREE